MQSDPAKDSASPRPEVSIQQNFIPDEENSHSYSIAPTSK
jgi:hypothetical protein